MHDIYNYRNALMRVKISHKKASDGSSMMFFSAALDAADE